MKISQIKGFVSVTLSLAAISCGKSGGGNSNQAASNASPNSPGSSNGYWKLQSEVSQYGVHLQQLS